MLTSHKKNRKQQYSNARVKLRTALLFSALLFCFFGWNAPHVAAQQAPTVQTDVLGTQDLEQTLVLQENSLGTIVGNIINVALSLLGIIVVGIVLYGGFLIMTSNGDQGKVDRGRTAIKNGVIGVAIVLSSFLVTRFILNALYGATQGTGGNAGGNGGQAPIETFYGSGSLGRIVEDHYPERNETGVKRNTKILVTFAEAFDPESIIEDTNNTGVYGDCLTEENDFDWQQHCDHLKPDAVQIVRMDNENPVPVSGAALTTYEGEAADARVLSIRPFEFLGENTTPVRYQVTLTANILKKPIEGERAVSIFDAQGDRPYIWEFETDTTFDFEPPEVVQVFPAQKSTIARNGVIQLTFSEPMDPVTLQGTVAPGSGYRNIVIAGQNNAPIDVRGTWNVSNNYKTVAFTPNEVCGQNSCGDVMYCLPVTCEDGEQCTNGFSTLVRTAQSLPDSFEARPFTGVTDLAGNALDTSAIEGTFGRGNGVRELPPAPQNIEQIDPNELVPDNFYFTFLVENRVNRTAPYITQVEPPLDGSDIPAEAPLTITFSDRMLAQTFAGISLEEYPANVDGIDDIWYRHQSSVNDAGQTVVTTRHREFGPNNRDLYYFVSVSSSVQNIYQNCMYPGRGPSANAGNRDDQGATSFVCAYTEDANGNVIESNNCIQVTAEDAARDTACAQTLDEGQQTMETIEACKTYLKSISPTNF